MIDFLPRVNPDVKWGCGNIIVNDKNEVLMGLRCKNEDKRQWSFVGGSVELNETPKDAVVRETMEESSLQVSKVCYLGSFELDGVHDFIFFTLAEWCTGEPVPAPREFAELKWVPLEEIENMTYDLFPYSKKAYELLIDYCK